ncbi:hypothetical protein IE53DRAFT_383822 [Violaceomyces palustris]|uniref:Uncharacterized protein n=1 Tax=Violaceomyces palustris TaxID=1673888 RepID=A0ACD0P666_9BASI|nr:hypothetical protein IE53DRAFT_383822 [Violaceomyces palustris]
MESGQAEESMKSKCGSGEAKDGVGCPRPQERERNLSTALWLFKHTQGIVTAATAVGILHLRTSHAAYFATCAVATSFTAKGLKRIIKQPRPPGSRVKKSSGMPSTHSASISFMGTYILFCSILLPLHPAFLSVTSSGTSNHAVLSETATRAWISVFSIMAPVGVMWSRVKLGVHTPNQTYAGAALGILKAFLWFTLWNGVSAWTAGNLLDSLRGDDLIHVGLGARYGHSLDKFISGAVVGVAPRWIA